MAERITRRFGQVTHVNGVEVRARSDLGRAAPTPPIVRRTGTAARLIELFARERELFDDELLHRAPSVRLRSRQ